MIKILLMEDDLDLCQSIQQELMKNGYSVDCCNDGEIAMLYALNTDYGYDLAIVDRMLPVIDGLTIIKAMRRKNIQIPVIIITGMSALDDRVDGLDGGADDYLRLLVEEIIQEAEKELLGPPAWRGIAGYSLAGLFALYAIYQTDVFSRVGCMSGSLWFPGFKEYIFSHEPKRRPDCIYFSLGEKEAKTRNPVLKTVQEKTEEIQTFYQNKGIDTVFQLNPGNHFAQGIERTAAGIQWLLNR